MLNTNTSPSICASATDTLPPLAAATGALALVDSVEPRLRFDYETLVRPISSVAGDTVSGQPNALPSLPHPSVNKDGSHGTGYPSSECGPGRMSQNMLLHSALFVVTIPHPSEYGTDCVPTSSTWALHPSTERRMRGDNDKALSLTDHAPAIRQGLRKDAPFLQPSKRGQKDRAREIARDPSQMCSH